MREAAALQEDLERAGITPYAWIINQSLAMQPGISDPLLKSRAQAEIAIIRNIENTLAKRTYGIPYMAVKNLLPELINQYSINMGKSKPEFSI